MHNDLTVLGRIFHFIGAPIDSLHSGKIFDRVQLGIDRFLIIQSLASVVAIIALATEGPRTMLVSYMIVNAGLFAFIFFMLGSILILERMYGFFSKFAEGLSRR